MQNTRMQKEGEFHDLYLQSNTLLVADNLETLEKCDKKLFN